MATCRALGRVGIPVIGIDTDLDQPSARTRYATKFHCPDFLSGGPGLVDSLEQIGRGLHEKGVLFPSGDLNLAVISEHRERLEPYFHISLPPKPVVEMFLNKKMFYQFAMDKGFPLPQTLFPKSPEHMRELAGRLQYPCLIKPFQPNDTWRKTFDTRLFVADSADNLVALFERLFRVHEDLIVQEYMPGPDSELWWGVTYLDEAGQPLVVWTGRKLRQYPRRFGTATLAESRWDPELARESVAILQAMGHRGYGVVEYKRDRRDGRLKITEVTGGRTWFPHSLVTRSGINLPLIWYRDALGQKVDAPRSYRGRHQVDPRRAGHQDGVALLPARARADDVDVAPVVPGQARVRVVGLGRPQADPHRHAPRRQGRLAPRQAPSVIVVARTGAPCRQEAQAHGRDTPRRRPHRGPHPAARGLRLERGATIP